MSSNPYIETMMQKIQDPEWQEPDVDPLEALSPMALAVLAVAHELAEANTLTANAAGWPLVTNSLHAGEVPGRQNPLSSEETTRIETGDARIAAAARRWADAYGRRNVPSNAATYHLAASELAEVIRREGER